MLFPMHIPTSFSPNNVSCVGTFYRAQVTVAQLAESESAKVRCVGSLFTSLCNRSSSHSDDATNWCILSEANRRTGGESETAPKGSGRAYALQVFVLPITRVVHSTCVCRIAHMNPVEHLSGSWRRGIVRYVASSSSRCLPLADSVTVLLCGMCRRQLRWQRLFRGRTR